MPSSLDETQRQLRRSEAALRALLEHLPDSVLLLDAGGAVVSCNPAAETLFGMPAAHLAGQPAAVLLGLPAGSLAVAGPGPLRLEAMVTRPDGAVPVEAALSALDIDGRPHLVASLRDVSAHRAALALERAAEQRRRAYFRTATHELRTPMASILGFSELLLKRDFDPETGRELLDIIHKQSTRLVDVINQMLDLARIDAGGPEEQCVDALDLGALLADLVERDVPAGREADVVLDLEPGLPGLRGNGARLRQAFANLLSNALRFSDPGARVEIRLCPAEREGRPGVAASVRDHGIGMTPAQRERMFEPFYRAGTDPQREGSGLGLALAADILAAHGATIETASRPGAGTTVALWLPAAEQP